MTVLGRFPFGNPLRLVGQTDRTPKRIFVLGVYASAVHARWLDDAGRQLVRALAVASEPTIFWDGSNADAIVSQISLPAGAGSLTPAPARLNGPSGRSLDERFLAPLGVGRDQAWLCDLVPHACLNPSQARALAREYHPQAESLGLPAVELPRVPTRLADDQRRAAIAAELRESQAEILVLLGDQPIKHFLAAWDPRWKALGDFGTTREMYGRLHKVEVDGRAIQVLPLVHPRQASGLGRHSPAWRALHRGWAAEARELW